MNRMQKAAWVWLLWSLVFNIHFAMTFIAIFLFSSYPRILYLILLPILVFFIAALVWSRQKQSPAEPECDERDRQISHRASVAAFIGLCILICISDAVILLWTGTGGYILAAMLAVIHFWLGCLTQTVYYAAIIILYGKNIREAEGCTK